MEAQVEHALAFGLPAGEVLGRGGGVVALDLGTGGGVPGLVLALAWPGSRWSLLDSRERSARFVEEAVAELGIAERVSVVLDRAESVGRDLGHRGMYRLVVARGFGPPAVTAECAAPLLAVGGRLVVSEPPGSRGDRWASDVLETLGLGPAAIVPVEEPEAGFAVLEQVRACPSTYPRRPGIPAKRPLFTPSTRP